MAYTLLSNQAPDIGYISWSGVTLSYDGVLYPITDGKTPLRYSYWVFGESALRSSDSYPSLAASGKDCLVFLNESGVAISILDSDVIHGGIIVDGTVTARAIAADAITARHISAGAIRAEHIDTFSINADHIQTNSITTDHLLANSITAGKLSVTNLEVDGVANIVNLNSGLLYSTSIAGALPVGHWSPNTPGGLTVSALNYFDLNNSVLRIGTDLKWFYVDPQNKGGSGKFWEVYGDAENYITMDQDGKLAMRLSVFEITSAGNLLFGADAMVAAQSRILYLPSGSDTPRTDHTAVVVSTSGNGSFLGTETGFIFHRILLDLKVGTPVTPSSEITAPSMLSIYPTYVSVMPGGTAKVGIGFSEVPGYTLHVKNGTISSIAAHIDVGYASLSTNFGGLELYRSGVNAATNGISIIFSALTSSSSKHEYAGIAGQIELNTLGAERGRLSFMVTDASTERTEKMALDSYGRLKIGSTSVVVTEALNVGGDISLGATTGDKVQIKYNATELSLDFVIA